MLDIHRIFAIESSNNPLAHDKDDDSRGLGQITPGVREDFNKANGTNISPDDLFDPGINAEITHWYANAEIPRILKAFGIEDTDDNRIIAYNAGPGDLRKIVEGKKELPDITEDYLIKYKMGGDIKVGQMKLAEFGFDPGPLDGVFGKKTKAAFQSFQESQQVSSPEEKTFGITNLKRETGGPVKIENPIFKEFIKNPPIPILASGNVAKGGAGIIFRAIQESGKVGRRKLFTLPVEVSGKLLPIRVVEIAGRKGNEFRYSASISSPHGTVQFTDKAVSFSEMKKIIADKLIKAQEGNL